MPTSLHVGRTHDGAKPFARIHIDAAARGLVHEIPAAGSYLDVGKVGDIDGEIEIPALGLTGSQHGAVRTYDFEGRIMHGSFERLARDRH